MNGTNYLFDGPHPIEDLLKQLASNNRLIANIQSRLTTAQARVTDITNQITALCTTPAP